MSRSLDLNDVYFDDGLTEEVITSLLLVKGPLADLTDRLRELEDDLRHCLRGGAFRLGP